MDDRWRRQGLRVHEFRSTLTRATGPLSTAAVTLAIGWALCACAPPETPPFVASWALHHPPSAALPAREDLVLRLILIGDAGHRSSDPVLHSLTRWGDWAPERTTVLFLGDNLYPAGLDEPHLAPSKEILQRQLEATSATKIFVPGNHDWGSPNRVATLRREQDFIDEFDAAEYSPENGCPGPAARTLVPAGQLEKPVTVIFMDLQWALLEPKERPICGATHTADQMTDALSAELEARRDEWVIVASHFPFRSGGPHGLRQLREFEEKRRGTWSRVVQDLAHSRRTELIERVGSGLASAPPLLAVAGHDHSLQLIDGQDRARYIVVSGAGSESKITAAKEIEGTYFAHAHSGFVVIDFQRSPVGDRITLVVVEPGREAPVFAMDLGTSEPAAAPAITAPAGF